MQRGTRAKFLCATSFPELIPQFASNRIGAQNFLDNIETFYLGILLVYSSIEIKLDECQLQLDVYEHSQILSIVSI